MSSTSFTLSEVRRLGRMKLRYLLLLVLIDDLRSIHKAALAIHISQPAATKLLAEIERLVETRLFERTTRGLAPNSHGESMIRHARTILATMGMAFEELDALRSGAIGKVRVGCIVAAEASILPRSVERVKATYPTLTVLIKGGTFDSLVPELKAGALDLVLARVSDDRDMSDMRYEALYEDPMVVVVRAGHPLLETGASGLKALSAFPWIWPPAGSVYRSRLETAFRKVRAGLPTDLVESESMLVNEALIRHSDRIAALPASVAAHLCDTGLFTVQSDVVLPLPSGQLGILLPQGDDLSVGVGALVAAIQEVAAERFGDQSPKSE